MVGNSPLAFLKEFDNHLNLGGLTTLILQMLQGLTGIHFLMIDYVVCRFDLFTHIGSGSGPFHAHNILTNNGSRISIRRCKRRHIFHDLRAAGHHGIVANVAELMDGGDAGNQGPVTDMHMTGQYGAMYQDILIANDAVVSYMEVPHQIVLVADGCGSIQLRGTVNICLFPEDIVVANQKTGGLGWIETQILAVGAQDGMGIDSVVLSDGGMGVDAYMGTNAASFAYLYIAIDYGVRTDLHAFMDVGSGIYNCSGMYGHTCIFFLGAAMQLKYLLPAGEKCS